MRKRLTSVHLTSQTLISQEIRKISCSHFWKNTKMFLPAIYHSLDPQTCMLIRLIQVITHLSNRFSTESSQLWVPKFCASWQNWEKKKTFGGNTYWLTVKVLFTSVWLKMWRWSGVFCALQWKLIHCYVSCWHMREKSWSRKLWWWRNWNFRLHWASKLEAISENMWRFPQTCQIQKVSLSPWERTDSYSGWLRIM